MDEQTALRACFTGHRPEKLTEPEDVIIRKLEVAISDAVDEGYTVFISGMARGVDIWAAEIVLRLRDSNPQIKLVCASPFEGFEKAWGTDWQQRYMDIMERADSVHFICQSHSRASFQMRNKWMVDRADMVIAVFNGEKGGTKNTIDYANRNMVHVKKILTCVQRKD